MKNRSLLLTSLLFVICLALITSCRKKDDTTAIVTVLDANSAPVSGAEVRVYGSGTQGTVTVDDITQTNSSGEAIFNYNDEYQLGQAGVVILDITVTKDGYTSQGIIKIEQETTNKKVIVIGV